MPDEQPEAPPAPPSGPLSTRLNASGAWPPGYIGRPGQRPPRRFSAITFVQALWPGYVQQFDGEVPEEFWTQEEETELGERVAVVACPCGSEPRVEQNRTAICPGECGRAFMLVGEKIKVAKFEPGDLAAPTH